jgi:PST family polysaccharide transporter
MTLNGDIVEVESVDEILHAGGPTTTASEVATLGCSGPDHHCHVNASALKEDPLAAEILKLRTIRGVAAKLIGQFASLLLRLGSLIVLARLLDPGDFGLVAMVTVIAGVFNIFVSAGLSAATVQRLEVSHEQVSALFWITFGIGLLLAILCLVIAPFLSAFYHEAKAGLIIATLAPTFVFNSLSVHHLALLQRQMRYVQISAIEFGSQLASAATGILMALAGFGYWALVASLIAVSVCLTMGAWAATGWVPSLPRRDSGVSSMLQFGTTITLINLVVYTGYNLDKVLLGRYFGPDALGLYGRAYQLVQIPTDVLNATFGSVTFSALARLQNDPARFRSYFLKSYSLVVSITLPTTMLGVALADDIVLVVLGPKWHEAAAVFRLLAPTILVFGIINPLPWLLDSVGLQVRTLSASLAVAAVASVSYLIGIPYGPKGVALTYSVAMSLWLVPHVFWCVRDTVISAGDILSAASRPLLWAILATSAAFIVRHYAAPIQYPLLRLSLASATMGIIYILALLFIMRQKDFYLALLKSFKSAP